MQDYKKKYSERGTVYLERTETPFLKKDLNILEDCCNKVKKEFIQIGDAGESNHLWVGRFMSDKDRPRILNKNLSKHVIGILDNNKVKNFVKDIIGFDYEIFIRRIQFNNIEKDCFIGHHLDTDSNPDYLCACVIQLGKDYSGGFYRVYQKNNSHIDYKSNYQSLIISDCNYPHEVTKVTNGSRQSLVFFFSGHDKKNRRKYNEL